MILSTYIDYSNQCIPELVVTEDSVKRIISQLNNSAAGYDGLPASIMKQLVSAYIIPLTLYDKPDNCPRRFSR